jgi:hypothetical protein
VTPSGDLEYVSARAPKMKNRAMVDAHDGFVGHAF